MGSELQKNEKILAYRPANLFRSIEGVGGHIKITNKRLIFEPHSINFQKQILEIPLNKIEYAKPRFTALIIPNGMLVKLKVGVEYKFVVWKRNELIDLINKNIS